eukprot:3943035-Karenia_brevis.AAC.1
MDKPQLAGLAYAGLSLDGDGVALDAQWPGFKLAGFNLARLDGLEVDMLNWLSNDNEHSGLHACTKFPSPQKHLLHRVVMKDSEEAAEGFKPPSDTGHDVAQLSSCTAPPKRAHALDIVAQRAPIWQ